MLDSDRDKLRDYFLACARDMLATTGVVATECSVPERAGEWVVAAVIGFGGDVLRGTLTTLIPIAWLRKTYPVPVAGTIPADDDVVDWAGEFANQLLGRIKHKLLPHGVVLSLSTPKTMFAETLRLSSHARGQECAIGFLTEGMQVGMWLDFLAESDKELFGEVLGEVAATDEGELVLF